MQQPEGWDPWKIPMETGKARVSLARAHPTTFSEGATHSIRHLHGYGLRSSQVASLQVRINSIHGWICLWQS